MVQRYAVLNIWVDDVTTQEVLDAVVDFVEKGSRVHTIFASNPEKNFSVPQDPILYEKFKKADLLLPDGIGMVLAVKCLYGVRMERVTGIGTMQAICRLAAERGYGVFIYGAKEEVNKAAVDNLGKMFPGLQIAGRAHGYQPEDQMEALVQRLNDSGAKILFLALGSPKQEQWIARYEGRLEHVRVCQGIGGTLDVLAGKTKRAPLIFRRLGLEWLYRLVTEPKRWKRQKVYPVFAGQVLWAKMKKFFW